MSITRIYQTGFETQDIFSEVNIVSSPANVSISAEQPRTGGFSLRISSGVGHVSYVPPAPMTQARVSFHHRNGQVTLSQPPCIFALFNGSDTLLRLFFDGAAFRLQTGGTTVLATVPHAGFAVPFLWYHFSVDFRIHASAGWFRLYVDGDLVMDYTGKTDHSASAISAINLGIISGRYQDTTYFDDIYVDDTSGEGAPTFAPDRRFDMILVSGNGASSEWRGSDGDYVDNYLLVDDVPPDSDNTYVTTDTVGQTDLYEVGTVTLPAGWTIAAVIPFAYARKDSAGSPLDVKLLTYLADQQQASPVIPLNTDYHLIWDRQVSKPGGGSWAQADLNNMQVGIQSE